MTSIESVIGWLERHGYKLTHRRRDASVARRYLYVFSHKSKLVVAVGVLNGQVKDSHWKRLAQVVLTNETDNKD